MYYVTLKALRKESACYEGYNKVVRALQGEEFTEEDIGRESYIRFKHDEQIPISFILESNGLDDALWALRACEQTPKLQRDARLFAVWCARQVQHLMTDERSIAALDVAERFANGEATREELAAARDAAWDAARDAAWDVSRDAARDAARYAAWDVSRYAARYAAWYVSRDAARYAARDAAWDVSRDAARDAAWYAAWDAAWYAAWDAQKQKFIEMFCS